MLGLMFLFASSSWIRKSFSFLSSSRATSTLCQKGSAVGDVRKLPVRSHTSGLEVMKILLCMRWGASGMDTFPPSKSRLELFSIPWKEMKMIPAFSSTSQAAMRDNVFDILWPTLSILPTLFWARYFVYNY